LSDDTLSLTILGGLVRIGRRDIQAQIFFQKLVKTTQIFRAPVAMKMEHMLHFTLAKTRLKIFQRTFRRVCLLKPDVRF
jgi:hypothetical protein